MNVLAIIPARGGSKGIVRKNLRLVAGDPLLVHSIVHAKQCAAVGRVVISTDDGEIGAVARQVGAEVIQRPAEISGDKAPSESALIHVLDYLKERQGYEPDLVVFLQATSPIRSVDDIERAIETLKHEGADSLFSACRVEGFTWRLIGGSVAPVNYDPVKRPLRQDLREEIWEENGSLYIFKPWVLRRFNSRLGGRIVMHKMERLASFQIDEPADLELLQHLMAFNTAKGGNLKPEVPGQQREFQPSGLISQASALNRPSGLWFHPSALKQIRLLVLDFDGVMTDNRVLVAEDGHEAVLCSREDGLGLEMLRKAGCVEVAVISKEKNPVVAARCRKLGIECIQGCDDKLAALKKRAESGNLKPEKDATDDTSGLRSHPSALASQIAYVGNDINDLACLRWVGLPIAVADAAPEVLAAAKQVTSKPGGHGAVREICDLLLRAI